MAGKLLTHNFGDATVFVSVREEVKCSSTDICEDLRIGSTQEEPDTEMIVYIKYCHLNGS